MKWFAKYFENLIVFITFLVLLHWIYQLVWGWERFWQGLVLFSLLSVNLTYQDAVRVYLWDKYGYEIPGLSKGDQKKLVELVIILGSFEYGK